MKITEKLNKKQIAIAAACLLLAGGLLTAFLKLSVSTPAGRMRRSAEELQLVLSEEELPLLEQFQRLRRVDLSGSTCYAAILAWQQAHPETEVRYTVRFPDGTLAENTAKSLDLSALDPSQAEDAMALLAFLPALESVQLGDLARGLTPEQAQAFFSAWPALDFGYSFTLFGQTLTQDTQTLDLRGRGHKDLPELLRCLPLLRSLKTADLGSDEQPVYFSWEDIAAMEAARPDVEFLFDFTLFGKAFSLTDSSMDLNHIPMDDGGAAVREVIACMPELTYLDMDSCRVSNKDMLSLREDFPNVKIVWRVWFGDVYTVRTDVEMLLASMPGIGGNLDDRYDAEALSCCNEVKYLDLGHNGSIRDISFVSSMPNLEVAILAMNDWSDASPLADCPHLEYLEIQTTYLSDLTPLSGLKELKHLNLCYLVNLTDISPLYELTQLERLWLGCLDPVPQEQIEEMYRRAPGIEINTTTLDPTYGGWRFKESDGSLTPRYALLREQFCDYSTAYYAFAWNDPTYW